MSKLQEPSQVRLRKISSLENSELFSSLEAKNESQEKRISIEIPAYKGVSHYQNSLLKRLYSRANYLRAILQQRLSGRDYPVIAIIVVNNKCNWNCTYCFGDYPNRKETDYTTDEIKFLVDKLYDMGVRYLNLHGGETLLRPDIGELCRYVKQKGIYLCVITNGSLLEKKLEDVRCVDNLTISLDGNQEGNDKNRGSGSFAKTLKAIELAKKSGIPLRVSATLTKYTKDDVEFLAKLAKRMDFQLQYSILFKPLKQAKEAELSPEEVRKIIDDIRYYKRQGYPIFASERALTAAYEWPYDFNEVHHLDERDVPSSYKSHQVACFYSRTKFTIEADGYVYPCFLTTDGSFSPKNWKTEGIEAAIEHVRKTNQCRACPAIAQNDHNLLLGLNPAQLFHIFKTQIKELY